MATSAAAPTFRLLGQLEVVGVPNAALGGPKQRALLVHLLLRANEVVPTDALVDALWGEDPPPTASAIVHGYVGKLRRALDGSPATIVTRSPGYVFEVDPTELDTHRFDQLARAGRKALAAGQSRRAAEVLREALELWRGEPLADLPYEAAAQREAARLDDLRLEATMDRIDAELAVGNGDLVGELEALVAKHPFQERLRRQLMVGLYRAGRQSDALEAYHQARRKLVTELGLEPGPALREAEQAILRHDPALGPAPSQPPASAPERRRRRTVVAAIGAILTAAAVVLGLTLGRSGAAKLRVPPNAVGVIDPGANRVVATIPVGRRPGPVVASNGSVLVANLQDGTLSRIDPRSRRIDATVPVGGFPAALAVSGEVDWVGDPAQPAVSRVAGSAVEHVALPDPFPCPDRPAPGCDIPSPAESCGSHLAMALGAGRLWIACGWGRPTLTTIDAATGRIAASGWDGNDPAAVAFADGAVWIADYGDNDVREIDPETGTVARSVTVAAGPTAIAAYGRSLWVTGSKQDAVSRIEFRPGETSPTVTTIHVGDEPTAIAGGESGVWVANAGARTVSRIDPVTNRVIATIPIGGVPAGIAAGAGAVWVTAQAP